MRSTVTADQLRALHPPTETRPTNANSGSFDLAEFLSRLGVDYTHDVHEGSERYRLDKCPFDPGHGRGESAIFRRPSGALGFKCQHNSCADRTWQDVRTLVDGPRESRQNRTNTSTNGTDKSDKSPFGTTEGRHNSENFEWPEPQPIQATLPAVPAFDADTLLPQALRAWIMDEADRMPCPPDFIASAALVALGSIIGARCAIKPKTRDDWLVVPNLWGGVVGTPSTKKTPSINSGLKPIGRLIVSAKAAHQAEMEAFETDETVFDARKKAIEKRIEQAARDPEKGNVDGLATDLQNHRRQAPETPVMRRYKSNDTTVEKLGELLKQNPAGLLVARDELVGLLASWDRQGREGDREFYLEAWNGCNDFDTDRIGRGSIFIQNLCVSLFGGIQPDKLTGYLEQAAHALANDGMLQRFQLLVYPDHCLWEWRDRIPDKQARDRAFDVFKTLADFDPVTWDAAPADTFAKFPHFGFDEAAQAIFIEWCGDLHHNRLANEEHSIIQQHLAKYEKLFAALALIFHLVECAASKQRGKVSEQAALRAAAWCEYLEAHARRCYGLLMDDGLRAAQALAAKLTQGKLPDKFTARDVRRNRWRYLTTADAVQAALDWLEDEHWIRGLREGYGQGSGKSPWRYSINPKILQTSKQGAANAAVCD